MTETELHKLLDSLVNQPKESEWVEFKVNNSSPQEIGERLSALSNGASLHNQPNGYLVFGVEDNTQQIVGTKFHPKTTKKGNEELEHWLAQRLNPRIDFRIYEFQYNNKHIALFRIPSSAGQPVRFSNKAYIRVGSITRDLNDFAEKEKKIWRKDQEKSFEEGIVLDKLTAEDVIHLLDCQSYFDLMQLPFPTTQEAVLDKLKKEKFAIYKNGYYQITNLGGILFAKDITAFEQLARRAVRVIIYDGKNRIKTVREQVGKKGYAVGFSSLIDYINDKLPANEEIGKALRETVRMYPEITIRELVANAIIHQDFHEKGAGPIVEIFSDRIEITNPGVPIITPLRFIDEYQSRNENLASIMRRLGICEEKGSGIDKVIFAAEFYQLPAPEFIAMEKHTKAIMYAYQKLNDMDKKDRIRACYQHCCLRYVSNEKMTNQTLRERFKIEEHNAAIASRIIRDTIKAELIKDDDPESKSRKYSKYIPFWA